MSDPIELIDLEELVGRAEIAERSGQKVATVDTWRRRHPTFPAPLRVLSGTPLWRWSEVEAWIHSTPRPTGRPTRSTGATAPLPDRLRRAIRTIRPDGDPDQARMVETA